MADGQVMCMPDPQVLDTPLAPLCFPLSATTSTTYSFGLPPNYLSVDPAGHETAGEALGTGTGVARLVVHADVMWRSTLALVCTSTPVVIDIPVVKAET